MYQDYEASQSLADIQDKAWLMSG